MERRGGAVSVPRRSRCGAAQCHIRATAAPRARQRRMGRSGGIAESGPLQRRGRSSGSCEQVRWHGVGAAAAPRVRQRRIQAASRCRDRRCAVGAAAVHMEWVGGTVSATAASWARRRREGGSSRRAAARRRCCRRAQGRGRGTWAGRRSGGAERCECE